VNPLRAIVTVRPGAADPFTQTIDLEELPATSAR
jgi:hypothetical protein